MAAGFSIKTSLLLSPILAYLPEGVGGPGIPEASQNCTCPSGGKPEGAGRLVLSLLSVPNVTGVGILS